MSTEEVTTTTVTAVEEKDSSTDIFPEESVAAAAVSPSPEETESEATEDSTTETSSSEDHETGSTGQSSESSESSTNSMPSEMVAWMDSIEKIQYHFRADDFDEDRSFNFFKDTNGNTLKVTEFYVGDTPFVNVNDDIVMRRDDFLSVSSVTNVGGSSLLRFDDTSSSVMMNASTNLVAEALMILGDQADSDSDVSSEASSDDEEDQVAPEPEPQPLPKSTDSQNSVVNFLYSFFLAILIIKGIGTFVALSNRH
jgi:hypothetical protein